ncbi:hypothetical protein OIDMADRAFT_62393 [Oidiodendron maius Zn]|uniref:AB hydrolase-1 domain-containing protein n=1 Tax=Oidiodendron maius (strain Zn) TaxID=913774 RepID=A0A0C3GQ58_OIDMZ|nr:hypothetical protein OIDMADRAFT_62393 [Oidiodendron maius Zn]
MDLLTPRTLRTSRGFTYSYYVKVAVAKPTLLFLHGFPETAQLWAAQAKHFVALGYGVIIPDCLGYGGSSKPTQTEAYNSQGVAGDIIEILDAEKVDKVVPVGHDWGSYLAGRIYFWHPDRVLGVAFLSVPFNPAREVTLQGLVRGMQERLGYNVFAYWEFLTADDAGSKIETNLKSFFTALFMKCDDTFKSTWCETGKLRSYVERGEIQPTKDFADSQFEKQFISAFQEGGFTGPLQSYHAVIGNNHYNHEKELSASRFQITKPSIYVGGSKDSLSPPGGANGMRSLVEDLRIEVLDSSHWLVREQPSELNRVLESWIKEKI